MKKDWGCKRGIPHKMQTKGEDNTVVAKECLTCHHKAYYKKLPDGTFTKESHDIYLNDHVRDFCQPYGETSEIFRWLYPEDYERIIAGDKLKKSKEKQHEVIQDITKDARNTIRRQTI